MENIDFSEVFKNFLEEYSRSQIPVQVDFRDVVSNVKFHERGTHSIHIYPAKLLPNIPYFFLNNSYFINSDEIVLDPFMGSGTVLLEAILSGKNSIGSDSNPIAKLISKVKTSDYDIEILRKITKSFEIDLNKDIDTKHDDFPDVVNIDYWFLPHIKNQLNTILKKIKGISDESYRDFFLLCFSNTIKKVSLADPRISVPVKAKITSEDSKFSNDYKAKLKNLESLNVNEKFIGIIYENIKRFENKNLVSNHSKTTTIIFSDARELGIEKESVDLIITSPPYAGAQKYIRSCSLNLGWTELSTQTSLRDLDKQNIGRENYKKIDYLNLKKTQVVEADLLLKEIYLINPLRAHIAANYLLEMRQAIKESVRVLKKNKYFILIAANNQVCGKEFKTQDYLRQIAEEEGMETICRLIDDIKSYGLMTKRNKTASIITSEWVLILRKK